MNKSAFLAVVVLAAGCLLPAALRAAAPVALSINPGYSFLQYSGPTAVGSGQISTPSTLFYIDEKQVGGLKSWYIFFEPGRLQGADAALHFDGAIQSVLTTRAELDATNAIYGVDLNGDSVANDYDSRYFVGLEPPNTVSWLPGGSDLHLRWLAFFPGDHVRVLVAVPEPASVVLFAVGLLGVGVVARRRARR